MRYPLASLWIAAFLTAAIVIVSGYHRAPDMLALRLSLVGSPILLPLLIASAGGRYTGTIWSAVLAILSMGWGYVLYAAVVAGPGDGPSFAIVIGWLASAISTAVAVLGVASVWLLGVLRRNDRVIAPPPSPV